MKNGSLLLSKGQGNDGSTASLNNLIDWKSYIDVHYGIKLGYKNIGWNGKYYTFPYFLTFFLKRFLKDRSVVGISHGTPMVGELSEPHAQ